MTLSSSPESYVDCKALWERAFASERGIRVPMETESKAIHLRHRLNKYRLVDRKESTKIYPSGDPNHGKSRFDPWRVECDGCVVLIRPLTIESLTIEDIE